MHIGKLYIVFILTLIAQLSFGQAATQMPMRYKAAADLALKQYTINNGLPSRNATAVIKGRNGFMWIGTENGLCKFDGYTFKTFSNVKGDSTSISNNFINTLTEDRQGHIWVGTMDGLNLFDPVTEKFTRFYHRENDNHSLSNNKIWCLYTDSDGVVWIGTDNGFNQYIAGEATFKTYLPNTANPYAIKGKSVNAIVQQGNNLWLGNWGEGLNKFDRQTGRFYNYKQAYAANEKNPNDIWALSMDAGGVVWIGTYWKGLYSFDTHTQKFNYYLNKSAPGKAAFTLLGLNKNQLLVGDNECYWQVNTLNNVWTKIDGPENNPHGKAYRDQDGLLWIAAKNGLSKIDHEQNKFSYDVIGDKQTEVNALLVKGGFAWIGTNKGLIKQDMQRGTTKVFKHKPAISGSLANDQVRKIYLDNSGKMWVLTELGFDEFDPRNDTFKHHYHHSALGKLFNEDVFRDILEIKPGIYALATDAGLKIYNSANSTFAHYFNHDKNESGLSNNHLSCLLQDKDNNLWIGTMGGGLNRFNPATGKFKVYQSNNKINGSLSDNTIKAMYMDVKGNVWICTPNGLDKYVKDTDSFISYSTNNGFASNVFNDITADRQGRLWLATEKGVSCFDPVSARVDNFDDNDGVLVNTVINHDERGRIFVAGDNGLVFSDPALMRHNTKVPPVYLTDFQIFNSSIQPSTDGPFSENLNVAGSIKLKYNQSVFSIGFVALNYSLSEKNQYAYMLEGFDKKWNYIGNQHKATYTNLDPGNYTFRVKAANNDGVWNEAGKSITIIITPPWYRTWLAYTCYIALGVLLVYLYIKYREHQASLKYEIKLAHVKGEQERELNEKKLSFFTSISHELITSLTLIVNPLKEIIYKENEVDMTGINTVYRNSRRLRGMVDQLMHFRKADAGPEKLKAVKLDIIELCKEVFLCFSYQAKIKNIAFDFTAPEHPVGIYADREKVEIVLFNLVANALKFTPEGGRVSIAVIDDEKHATIKVADSGFGIADDVGEKLYNSFYQQTGQSKGGFGIGLYLAKTFVAYHKGNISYQSSPGEGTVFTVELLKGHGHLQPDEIFENEAYSSVLLQDLAEEELSLNSFIEEADEMIAACDVNSDFKSILIIDDNKDFRDYLKQIFRIDYRIYEAADGISGLEMIREVLPDIVISDVMMGGMTGIELCATVKDDIAISHIPFILLTSSSSSEVKLKGLEGGADDYISKPFDKDILKARVAGILKSKNNLQKYFYNEITLNNNPHKISIEYKNFLENCITVVERYMDDPDFNIQVLASELGVSHSGLYKKIKFISGQSASGFIRFIRLRKAAYLFINTDYNIQETSYQVGINDIKYFREQFKKLFKMNPSEYIKKYRKTFQSDLVNHD
ncbi:MAG: hypothetical protein C0154_14545 [Mucilaginibacter sp.]|nr:MAG: hypothetical protein C0154_14545 [Mucilaginibacter sp.]HEK21677.1 hybrid sensor histidine kinase/response regulator [Bacteroidota bacterium]